VDINYNINFPDLPKSYDDYSAYIKVNLIDAAITIKHLKKTIDIDSIDFKISFNKNKIDAFGIAKVNNTDVNLIILNLKVNKLILILI